MGKNMCAVTHCRNGQTSLRTKNKKLELKKSVFKAPRDVNLLEKWTMNLPGVRKKLTNGSFICEDHFDESDITRSFKTVLSDGSVFEMKRGTPLLRSGAIPVLLKSTQCVKQIINETSVELETSLSHSEVKNESVTPKIANLEIINKVMDITQKAAESSSPISFYDFLSQTYRRIDLPSCEWAVTADKSGEFITFVHEPDGGVIRKVKINQDLKVTILLDNMNIKPREVGTPKSIADVIQILRIVNNFKVCETYISGEKVIKVT